MRLEPYIEVKEAHNPPPAAADVKEIDFHGLSQIPKHLQTYGKVNLVRKALVCRL